MQIIIFLVIIAFLAFGVYFLMNIIEGLFTTKSKGKTVTKPLIPKSTTSIQPRQFQEIIDESLKYIVSYSDNDITEQSDEFRVAGITFNEFKDSPYGLVIGYTMPEPDNPHDPHAIAFYSWDNRKIGYIARDAQDDFKIFADGLSTLPIVCYISYFEDSGIFKPMGEVTIIRGTKESIIKDLKTSLEVAHEKGLPIL